MKKCIIVAMAALFVSCSNQPLKDGVANGKSTNFVQLSADKAKIDALVEKARWGDGKAFLQLADCYRDGIGVKKDFLRMEYMVEQAKDLGAIEKEEDYFARLPEDNVYKQFFSIVSLGSSELRERQDSIYATLNAWDTPDALALCGMVSVECGDTIGGFEKIRKAADEGCDLASIFLAMHNSNGELQPDKNKLEQLADKIPLAYKALGKIYRVFEENNNRNRRQVAYYYLKAEKHALLTKRDASWLLSYYRDGGDIQLTDEDVKRLEAFSHISDDEKEVVVADTVCVDSIDNQ